MSTPPPEPPGHPYGQYDPYGQQGQQGQYGSPYPPPTTGWTPAPPSKAMAIWALVLGWIPCLIGFVLSVVFAILVLKRSRRGQDHGKKLAIGGLVGVGFWVLVVVAVLVIRPFAVDRDGSGQVTGAGDVTIDGMRVGDCGGKPLSGVTRLVHLVPCSEPHVFQVMATFELSDGAYPGDDTVVRLAEGGCIKRLSRMPALKGHPELKLHYLRPIATTWARQKTVVCMADTDQPTTGSLLGS